MGSVLKGFLPPLSSTLGAFVLLLLVSSQDFQICFSFTRGCEKEEFRSVERLRGDRVSVAFFWGFSYIREEFGKVCVEKRKSGVGWESGKTDTERHGARSSGECVPIIELHFWEQGSKNGEGHLRSWSPRTHEAKVKVFAFFLPFFFFFFFFLWFFFGGGWYAQGRKV